MADALIFTAHPLSALPALAAGPHKVVHLVRHAQGTHNLAVLQLGGVDGGPEDEYKNWKWYDARLTPLGEAWREENPYRGNELAIRIGSSGYNQNCARCHGLEVISGGIAPDLRYLDLGKEGDEWFIERVTKGAIQNGMTKMPIFAGTLSQEALWAIRTFIESKHDGS